MRGLAGVQDTLMYESLPLGEVDSRVGQFAKHDMKEKGAKPGEEAEAEESEVRAFWPTKLPNTCRGMSGPQPSG